MLTPDHKRWLVYLRRLAWLVILATLLFSAPARSDEPGAPDAPDDARVESTSRLPAVPPPSAACAPGPFLRKSVEAQAAPSPSTIAPEHDAPTPPADASVPDDPPLEVLLSHDGSRAAFELAEEAAYALEQARDRLRDSQARYALARVDYDRLADEIDDLAAEVRRTFRPDLAPLSSIAPPARPIQVDGPFWRIGLPQP